MHNKLHTLEDAINIINMSETTEQLLSKLEQDEENLKCFDCGRLHPHYASVNHGILICANCAQHHKELPDHISHVMSFTEDSWSLGQLRIMAAGGNTAFKEFLETYPLPSSITLKYRTKAVAFYREMLDVVASGRVFNEEPPLPQDGAEVCEGIPISKPSSWRRFEDGFRKASEKTKVAFSSVTASAKDSYNKINSNPSVQKLKTETARFLVDAGESIKSGTKAAYDRLRHKEHK